jgi:hypothetical protein
MLAGAASPGQICFTINDPNYLPADLDGSTPPADGSPGYFVTYETLSSLRIWKLAPNFATPAASTLTQATPDLAVTAFTELCSGGVCVPQPGTNTQLDSLADRPMYRLAYRNFGDHEAAWYSITRRHQALAGTSCAPLAGGVQRVPTGTYAPDATYRWMGSAAMDQAGDLAIGYSTSSGFILRSATPAVYPAIHWARLKPKAASSKARVPRASNHSAPLGRLRLLAYRSINDCTFWYISEYLRHPLEHPHWVFHILCFLRGGQRSERSSRAITRGTSHKGIRARPTALR